MLKLNVIYSQSNNLSSQDYIQIQDKARSLINTNIDSSFFYANKIELSKDIVHQSFACGLKSYLYQLKTDTIKSNQYYNKALFLLAKSPESIEKAKTKSHLLNYGGLIDWKRKRLNKAIDKFIKGKKISEELNDTKQIIKFNKNIGLIYFEIGNYKSAIEITKQSDKIQDKIQNLYTDEQLNTNKREAYKNIGIYYERQFKNTSKNYFLLDSALYYYKKSIFFSKNAIDNKIECQMNIANLLYLKNKISQAEKMYLSILNLSKENNQEENYYKTLNNLGNLYYYKKEYKQALVCYRKVDSLYEAKKINLDEYINSNYFQAKIKAAENEYNEASKHAKIYLENYEKKEELINNNATEINSKLSSREIRDEMLLIQKTSNENNNLKVVFLMIGLIIIITLIAFLVINTKKKKIAEQKVNDLITQFKSFDTNNSIEIYNDDSTIEEKPKYQVTSLSNEKELQILEKLKYLEEKLYYLNADFTQQTVAKKIKTNTSYISIVVNKYYKKNFGEYSNELRINYAINEMIKNPKYRKYSTQAIAESVGFKSAISFTKSFNKRTGVTPTQFIKGLEKNNV